MVTVEACIQEVPPDNRGTHTLAQRDVQVTAPSYAEAADRLRRECPDGWRLLFLRSIEPPSG